MTKIFVLSILMVLIANDHAAATGSEKISDKEVSCQEYRKNNMYSKMHFDSKYWDQKLQMIFNKLNGDYKICGSSEPVSGLDLLQYFSEYAGSKGSKVFRPPAINFTHARENFISVTSAGESKFLENISEVHVTTGAGELSLMSGSCVPQQIVATLLATIEAIQKISTNRDCDGERNNLLEKYLDDPTTLQAEINRRATQIVGEDPYKGID